MEYFFHQSPAKYIEGISGADFDETALRLFRYQYSNNQLYRRFTDALGVVPDKVNDIRRIPYLPVSFFKTHEVMSGNAGVNPVMFSSSTTSSDIPGLHIVSDIDLYHASLLQGFRQFYGDPSGYIILALLPSYLQRGGSSLVYMVQQLMQQGGHNLSGFYLDELEKLRDVLREADNSGRRVLLIGVTYALLDFAEVYPMRLCNTIVMETGGMKGRRKEMTREVVHNILKERLGVTQVHSEYGMTELLSQSYAVADGLFKPTGTMKIMVRDINDPLDVSAKGGGCINIIDLANVHSCAFLATDDVGKLHADGGFEVLGRADNSALRGCNLMLL